MSTRIRILSPWLKEKKHSLKCCSNHCSTLPHMSRLLENCRTYISLYHCSPIQVLFLAESRGQICPVVFILLRTFSHGLENNNTLKSQGMQAKSQTHRHMAFRLNQPKVLVKWKWRPRVNHQVILHGVCNSPWPRQVWYSPIFLAILLPQNRH